MERAKRHAAVWLLAPVLAACAAPVHHFGDTMVRADHAQRHFAMAAEDEGAPAAAVRDALVAMGFRETADAPVRVEVGFAVRPRTLAVTAPGAAGGQAVISPPAGAPLSLCHRRAYVLSVAMIDRATGTVKRRAGATTSRCRGTPAELLPLLARVVLADQS